MTNLLVLLTTLLLCLCHTTWSYPSYRQLIPNGDVVPDPCNPGTTWYGVGHLNAGGGGPRNQFGLDFAAANYEWTKELCEKDSDGDGLRNGEELGDPDCIWQVGMEPSCNTGISHPGVDDNASCD